MVSAYTKLAFSVAFIRDAATAVCRSVVSRDMASALVRMFAEMDAIDCGMRG